MFLYVDIETSGFEKDDKICSIGMLLFNEECFVQSSYELVNEKKKIPAKASALHNITNEMIADANSFHESKAYKLLQDYNQQESVLVVHNTDFVLSFFQAAGLRWHGTIIDTQRVAKHAILECEFFTLPFLRYELKLYRSEELYKKSCAIDTNLVAHHALHDALVIKMLYDYLCSELSFEEMARLSFENVLLEKFTFGKYQGRYIEEIKEIDSAYLHWLLSLEDLDSDVRYSITYYLEG